MDVAARLAIRDYTLDFHLDEVEEDGVVNCMQSCLKKIHGERKFTAEGRKKNT